MFCANVGACWFWRRDCDLVLVHEYLDGVQICYGDRKVTADICSTREAKFPQMYVTSE
jgi:hypothetical protein